MAFMHPSIHTVKERFLISDELDEAIYCKYNGIGLPVGEYNVDNVDDPEAEEVEEVARTLDIEEFEVVEQFHGVMEPNGCYTDRSDYILGGSIAEVAQQMLDMFYDHEPEYMDEDELSEVAWLEKLVKEYQK